MPREIIQLSCNFPRNAIIFTHIHFCLATPVPIESLQIDYQAGEASNILGRGVWVVTSQFLHGDIC